MNSFGQGPGYRYRLSRHPCIIKANKARLSYRERLGTYRTEREIRLGEMFSIDDPE